LTAEIRAAIEFHLEGMREDGAAIPKPSSRGYGDSLLNPHLQPGTLKSTLRQSGLKD
jgi:hypothetical protein